MMSYLRAVEVGGEHDDRVCQYISSICAGKDLQPRERRREGGREGGKEGGGVGEEGREE